MQKDKSKDLRGHLGTDPKQGGHGLTGSARHLDDHELPHTHTADHRHNQEILTHDQEHGS